MKKRTALIPLLLVTVGAPAGAQTLDGGFTTAEKNSVNALHAAIGDLNSAMHEAGHSGQITTDVVRHGTTASRLLFRTLSLLTHTNPEQVGTTLYNNYESASRATWVADAWSALAGAQYQLQLLAPLLTGSARTFADNAYSDTGYIEDSLAYATPLPADEQFCRGDPEICSAIAVYPTVIGPHGDQRQAMWSLNRAAHYFQDGWDNVADALDAETLTPAGAIAASTVLKKGSVVLDVIAESMMFISGLPTSTIPPPDNAPPMSQRTIYIQEVIEWLTFFDNDFSTPKHYNSLVADGLRPWIDTAGTAARAYLTDAMRRVSDSWRHSDRAAWMCLFFNF